MAFTSLLSINSSSFTIYIYICIYIKVYSILKIYWSTILIFHSLPNLESLIKKIGVKIIQDKSKLAYCMGLFHNYINTEVKIV